MATAGERGGIAEWNAALNRILGSLRDDETADVIAEITALAAAMGEETGEALLQAHPELYDFSPALTQRFRRLVLGRDLAEVERIMRMQLEPPVSFRDVASARSAAFYDRLDEVHAYVDFRGCRQLVMVGCGGRPFTVFHFHDKTDIPEIIGFDVVPEAVDTARALGARLGYSRARFEVGDGCSYDYGNAQVVYVSSMVSPKAAVVSRIAETAPDDVQIIVWDPVSLGRLWAESAESALDPRLEVAARGKRSLNLARDILLRRKA